MRQLKFEIKRALSETGFKLSLLIGCGLALLDLILFCGQFGVPGRFRLIQAWLGTDYQFAYNSLFYTVLPILACLPYAGSYHSDMADGYDKNICTRTSRGQYLTGKVVAVFLSGFLAIAIPLLLSLFLSAGLYPNQLPDKLYFLSAAVIDCHMFPELFHSRPHVYALVFTCMDGLIGGSLGLVSLAISRVCSNRFSTILTPFMVYVLTGVLFTRADGRHWSLMEMANPVQRYVTEVWKLVGTCVFLITASVTVTFLYSRKRDIL